MKNSSVNWCCFWLKFTVRLVVFREESKVGFFELDGVYCGGGVHH